MAAGGVTVTFIYNLGTNARSDQRQAPTALAPVTIEYEVVWLYRKAGVSE